MNKTLLKKYRTAYDQCFIPIFVHDQFDTEMLLEACRLADVKVIEYTLRRDDANIVIPTLKKRFPELTVMTGSNIDSEMIINNMKRLYPQLMTMSELNEAGVDGFVSMLPFSDETIKKYAEDHILIPSAATPGEALRQAAAGAHFIKMSGADLKLVKTSRAAPTFGYCPVFVTGGVTPEKMEEVYQTGAVLTASGFDLILKGCNPEELTAEYIAEKLRLFISTAKKARSLAFPQLAEADKMNDEEFLRIVPHYHPFN